MPAKTKGPSRLMTEMLELADAQLAVGTMDADTHEKITMLALNRAGTGPTREPITAEEIKAMREQAHMSQAVFAQYLNLTTGYVSKLERGAVRPAGAALALLNVIRRKGMEALI